MTKRKKAVSTKQPNRWLEPPCIRDRDDLPTVHELEWLADQYLEFVQDENILTLDKFRLKFVIGHEVFARYRANCPKLEEAHWIAAAIIGDRREMRALEFKKDNAITPSVYMRTMAYYNKGYKEHFEWQSKLTDKDTDAKQDIVVNFNAAPDSELVKKRK